MEHQGYRAEITYSAEEDDFLGRVVNIPARDLVLFRGRDPDALRADFAQAIADYEVMLRRAGRARPVAG